MNPAAIITSIVLPLLVYSQLSPQVAALINNKTWKSYGTVTSKSDQLTWMGYSVSLSGDGQLMAVGEPLRDNGSILGAGRCSVYEKQMSTDTWNQVFKRDGSVGGMSMGTGCTIAKDVKRVVLGAETFDGTLGFNQGLVAVYEEDAAGVWNQIGGDTTGFDAGERFGYSVDITADGRRIAVGGPNTGLSQSGNAYVLLGDSLQFPFPTLQNGNIRDEFGSGMSYCSCVFLLLAYCFCLHVTLQQQEFDCF